MVRIYLSGGITKVPNYESVFNRTAKDLKYKGLKTKKGLIPSRFVEIINPIKLSHNHNHTWISYMRECVEALCSCQRIYMLKGWWKSKGARVELFIALLLLIEVDFQ